MAFVWKLKKQIILKKYILRWAWHDNVLLQVYRKKEFYESFSLQCLRILEKRLIKYNI